MRSQDAPIDVNKNDLYGDWRRQANDRHKLAMRVRHKALDIPEGDDELNVDNSRHGLGFKELAIIAGSVLTGGALWQAPAIIEALKTAEQVVERPVKPLFDEYRLTVGKPSE